MQPQCFVVMPTGVQKNADGQAIDFDAVYTELLKPAIETAGLESCRADAQTATGNPTGDGFQALLSAGLVVADMTLTPHNLRYELGIRAALRARGLMLVTGARPDGASESLGLPMHRYHLKGGAPDPEFLDSDQAALAGLIVATVRPHPERKKKPVCPEPRPPAAASAALGRAPAESGEAGESFDPKRVFLFSGHRVDAPDRPEPRFPTEKIGIAARRIGESLDALGAGVGDLALTQGAAGGDILFAEACLERRVRVELMLPLPEPEFIQQSILHSADGDTWRQRYFALKEKLGEPRVMPVELGPLPEGVDPYERCNLWLLDTALSHGIQRLRFLCLWDGRASDGPGGTAHLYREVERRSGSIAWIDTRKL